MRATYRASSVTRAASRSRGLQAAKRFQSTATPPAQSSHVLAGVAGGAAVLLVGYGWYHYSGVAKVVNTARTVTDTAKQAKGKIVEAAPSLDASLKFLRSTAKSYAGAIPGAAGGIDYAFDRLDELAETHADEVKQIATDAYNEVQKELQALKGKDPSEAVLKIVNETVGKLNKLGGDLDKNYLQPFLEKNPAMKKALEGSSDQIKAIAEKQGPEAKRIRDDIYKQLTALVAGGLTVETAAKAVQVIREKSKEIQKLASDTGAEAYKVASKNAQPLLEQIPDVKKILDEQLPKVESYIGKDGVESINQMYEKLAELAKDAKNKDAKELAKEAEKIVTEGIEQAKKVAGKAASGLGAGSVLGSLESLPGFKDIPQLDSLKKIASERGDEAQKLVSETYEDIKKVLEDKAAKAAKLAEKAKEDTKKAK